MLGLIKQWIPSCIRWFILLFILSWLLFFHSRGFLPYDEGWVLQAALRFLRGDLVYKDIQFVYNPGVIYLTALSYRLFGISILSARIIALANSTVSVFLIYLIGKRLNFSKSAYLFSVLFYLFWGPPVINFVWPVMFCITTGLVVGYFFSTEIKGKKLDYHLFLSGVFSALTFVFKQNFGLAIVAANLLFFILVKKYRKLRPIVFHSAGYLLVILIQGLYFIKTNTLNWYVKESYYYTYIKIFKEGIFNSIYPWQYPAPLFVKILKIALYLSPLAIAIFALYKTHASKKKHLIYIPLLTIFYYLFSIRPTTDYVHLAPLIALSGLSLSVSYRVSEKSKIKLLLFSLGAFVVLLGGHGAIARNYYRWQVPLITQGLDSKHPKVRIGVDIHAKQSIEEISEYFTDEATDEKEILIYNFAPIFYLILDKQNPTKYDYLHSGVLTPAVEREIVEVLERKKIRFILANIEIESDPTTISSFIIENYQVDMRVNEYTVWRMKLPRVRSSTRRETREFALMQLY